jgi:hypothetical protein
MKAGLIKNQVGYQAASRRPGYPRFFFQKKTALFIPEGAPFFQQDMNRGGSNAQAHHT